MIENKISETIFSESWTVTMATEETMVIFNDTGSTLSESVTVTMETVDNVVILKGTDTSFSNSWTMNMATVDNMVIFNDTDTTPRPPVITNSEILIAGARLGMLPVSIIGILGNVLIILLVSIQSRVRSYPVSVYLTSLAIGDIIFCLDVLRWYLEWADLIPYEWGDIYCVITNFLGHFATGFAHWSIFCIASERMIRVVFPFRAKTLLTLKLARTMVIVSAVIVCLPNIGHFVFDHQVSLDNNTWICWTLQTDAVGPLYYNIVRILIETPPVILVVLINCVTVTSLRSHWARMKKGGVTKRADQIQTTGARAGAASMSKQERALTITLVVNGMLFVALETPYLVTEFIIHYKSTEDMDPLIFTVGNIFKLISGVDHMCNFFIYIIGSAMLRREFAAMFGYHGKTPSKEGPERQDRPLSAAQHLADDSRGSNLTLASVSTQPSYCGVVSMTSTPATDLEVE